MFQVKEWEKKGLELENLSINLSSIQFKNENLTKDLLGMINTHQVNPNKVILEITESIALQDLDYTLKTINELKEIGIRISLDDFGTGYSSLNYTKDIPFDEIKIDQSFVFNLFNNPKNKVITKTIVSLGKGLGAIIVAEGIERQEHLDFLRNVNCDKGQGYLFDKPLPANELFSKYGK